MNIPLFYRPKPVFGLDIGRSTVKLVQLMRERGKMRVVGYGYAGFDPSYNQDGVLVKPEAIAKAVAPVIKKIAVGKYTTNRVVASVPLAYTYTRLLNLPKMSKQDFEEAVKLETEQYIPVALKDLYIEHRIIGSLPPSDKVPQGQVQVLMVAVPQKIIGSFMNLFELLGLEVSVIEPNMFSNLRAIHFSCPAEGAQIIIDFGAQSSDLAVYDNTVRLTGTLPKGGEDISKGIASALKISYEQATKIKLRYGIGKSRWQPELATSLEPILSSFANEVQKMMRYYNEHSLTKGKIKDIVVVGGGANMPGLADFLTHLTGIKVTICNPWQNLVVKPLQPPNPGETTIYATAVGLALREFMND